MGVVDRPVDCLGRRGGAHLRTQRHLDAPGSTFHGRKALESEPSSSSHM